MSIQSTDLKYLSQIKAKHKMIYHFTTNSTVLHVLNPICSWVKNMWLIAGRIQHHPLVLGKEEMGLGLIYGREGQIGFSLA